MQLILLMTFGTEHLLHFCGVVVATLGQISPEMATVFQLLQYSFAAFCGWVLLTIRMRIPKANEQPFESGKCWHIMRAGIDRSAGSVFIAVRGRYDCVCNTTAACIVRSGFALQPALRIFNVLLDGRATVWVTYSIEPAGTRARVQKMKTYAWM
jgi:hypothetical protein